MPPDSSDSRLATQRQFGRQASHYAASSIHAKGESLGLVVEIAAVQPDEMALDVGTGAGFTAFALAGRPAKGARTIASDIAPGMLQQARRIATERGLGGLVFVLAGAEALPFEDGSFDIVTCRLAAHHFPDIPSALVEFRRVLKTGGRLVLCDTLAPEDETVAAYQHDLELRRDATHQRDHSPSRWAQMLVEAGLELIRSEIIPGEQEFEEWVGRAGTPPHLIPDLRRSLAEAPAAIRDEFAIRKENGSIYWHWLHGIFLAHRPR